MIRKELDEETLSISDKTEINRDEESYDSINMGNPSLTEIRAEKGMTSRISSYVGRLWNKLPEAVKKPTNYTKIIVIGAAAASNGYLLGENAAITYSLAGITCLMPVIFDIEHNVSLAKKAYIKAKEYKESIIKRMFDNAYLIGAFFISIVGVITGIAVVSTHIKLDKDQDHPASNIVIAVGTFISGVLQMGVKPLIRKALEKKEIKDIKDKGVDVEVIIENSVKDQTALVQRVRNIKNSRITEAEQIVIDLGDELESSNRNHNNEFKNSIKDLRNKLETEKAQSEEKSQKAIDELQGEVKNKTDNVTKLRDKNRELKEEKRKLKDIIDDQKEQLSNKNTDFVKTTGKTR